MTPGTPLPAPARLVGDGMRLLRERFWLLLSVMGAGSVAAGLAVAVPLLAVAVWQFTGSPGMRAWGAALLLSLSAGLWLASWAQVAMCRAALDEQPTVASSLRRAWPRVGPFSWACILYMVLVGGGFFLLVLPGLYLAAALVFAPFISLDEDVSGWEACLLSLRYARGRWLGLTGRLLLVAAVATLPSLVPIVGWIIGGLLAPLPLLCLCLLYRDVRASASAGEDEAPRWPLALGLLGWLPGLWLAAGAVGQVRAMWPQFEMQARLISRNLDAGRAQQVLDSLQSGQAGPQTALQAVTLLQNAAAGVSISTAPATSPGAAPR